MTPLPGDFVLVRSSGFIARVIRLGEFLRLRKRAWARWNHAALVTGKWDDGRISVIQAEGRGVVWGAIQPGVDAVVVPVDLDARGRQLAVGFAIRAIGRKYGWLTIASIVADIITPNFIDLKRPGTFICSGLVARALAQGGCDFPIAWDLDQVMPAELAQRFGVRNG